MVKVGTQGEEKDLFQVAAIYEVWIMLMINWHRDDYTETCDGWRNMRQMFVY